MGNSLISPIFPYWPLPQLAIIPSLKPQTCTPHFTYVLLSYVRIKLTVCKLHLTADIKWPSTCAFCDCSQRDYMLQL